MQPDEALRGGPGGFPVAAAIVGVDDLDLGLFGKAAERESRFQRLVSGNRAAEVLIGKLAQRALVKLFLAAETGKFVFVLVIAEPGAGYEKRNDEKEKRESREAQELGHESGRQP